MVREEKNEEKNIGTRVIWLIVFQFIVIFIVIVVGQLFKDKVTETVFIGIAASLGAWLLTDLIRKGIDKSFEKHDQKTTKILEVVTGKHLSLISLDRGEMTSKQYEEYYQNANEIKISGIALKGFSNYLIAQNSQDNPKHLFKHIIARPINVKILFVHPKATLVKQRKSDGDVEGDIKKTIDNFKSLYNKINESNIFCRGSIEVRLTTKDIYSSLFHAKGNNDNDNMLMGMLFYHIRGDESPLYQIPKDKHSDLILYNLCEGNFDFLFHDAIPLFSWRGDSFRWNEKWEIEENL